MKKKNNRSEQAAELRQNAEAMARENATQLPEDIEPLSPEETRRTLHELRIHQIELEAQNEELRRTQVELGTSRARYFDLFDLAPVGYLTLSDKLLILEANLTAATLLGVDRSALAKQPLTRFILREDQDIFYLHRKQLFETGKPQTCELRLAKKDGTIFWVRLEADLTRDTDGRPLCRAVLSDITERKQAELILGQQAEPLQQLARQIISAQEEERRRISLELHDELGQALTGIGFDLAAIERKWPPEIAVETRGRLVDAISQLAELDEQVSDMALNLRPQMLDDLGLLPTLRWYVNRYIRRTGIAVKLETVATKEIMTPEMTTTIYRVVQEALTNVARHAAASSVAVRLACGTATLTVVVQDNGRGFEVDRSSNTPLQEHGIGLLGVRERVALLGGTCDIQSHPGQGTRLAIEIPI